MNRQRILLIALALCSASLTAQGQKFYLTAGLGVGFNAASQTIDDNYQISTTYSVFSLSSNISDEAIAGSYAKGMNYGGAIGYMFTNHFAMEAGFSTISAADINSSYDYLYTDVMGGQTYYTHTINRTTTRSASMSRISVAVKMSTGDGSLMPYVKTGMVMGVNPSLEVGSASAEHYAYTSPAATYDTVITSTSKFTNGFSLGFIAALGVDCKLSDAFYIYAEVGMIAQAWAPEHGEYTSYTLNGQNQLPTMTTNQKQVDFTDSYSQSSADASDPNSPAKAIKTYQPFSTWGFNVGIHYNLGKKATK